MTVQIYEVHVYKDSRTEWFQDGKRHRIDGPAIEWADGRKYWLQNGKFHRTDGPACDYGDGDISWYIDDEKLTEEQFNNRVKSCEGKIVEIDGKKYKLTEI